MKLICHFDGACEPKNPGGNMGVGAYVQDAETKKYLFTYSAFIPAKAENSNNVAEYLGFECLLDWICDNVTVGSIFDGCTISIFGDSMLVIAQMLMQWKIKNGRYVQFAHRCKEKLAQLRARGIEINLGWVRRTENGFADELSKEELLSHNVQFKIQPSDR